MKVVFVSNFMNHHQKALCDEFVRHECEFTFIAYADIPKERLDLGYRMYELPYVMRRSMENDRQIEQIVLNAEIVIFGEKPEPLFRKRLQTNKMTFIFSERLFKKRGIDFLRPLRRVKLRKKYLVKKENPPFLLCAGAYVERDYRSFGFPKGRAYKWGYFPEISTKPLEEIKRSKDRGFTMLWVGRFIPWKHPEVTIEIAEYLKKRKIPFTLKMIGNGGLTEAIRAMAKQKGVADDIEIMGSLNPEKVKEEMEKSHVLLMTSDRNEGWGAVVNEAMSCACTVVSTSQPGCVPYLISHRENGLIVKKEEYADAVLELSQDPNLCGILGRNAYDTIHNQWNHEIAARRFLDFVGSGKVFKEGPMSLNK